MTRLIRREASVSYFRTIPNYFLDVSNLQDDIKIVSKWAVDWSMSFNEDKCKFMVFNNKHFTIDLTMNGKPLSRTDNERDLGIHISSDLKWSRQAGEAANRANMVLGRLRRVFKC